MNKITKTATGFIIGPEDPRPTRYKELGYRNDAPGLWRIVTTEDNQAVGPFYVTKTELLADLSRYAKEYGCD